MSNNLIIGFRWKNFIIPKYVPSLVYVSEREAFAIIPDDEEAQKAFEKFHAELTNQISSKSYRREGEWVYFLMKGDDSIVRLMKLLEEEIPGEAFTWRLEAMDS